MRRKAPYVLVSLLWVTLCAVAFVALDEAPDPSRRTDRILSNDAGRIALQRMRERNPERFRDFEVVHVAHARRMPGRSEPQWIVLLDRVPHTGLAEAVVVELRAEDGGLLGVRGAGLEK